MMSHEGEDGDYGHGGGKHLGVDDVDGDSVHCTAVVKPLFDSRPLRSLDTGRPTMQWRVDVLEPGAHEDLKQEQMDTGRIQKH